MRDDEKAERVRIDLEAFVIEHEDCSAWSAGPLREMYDLAKS